MVKHYTKGFILLAVAALVAVIKQDAPSNGDAYPSGYLPCYYHGNEGMKSIIGHLIDDDNYHVDLEGHTMDLPKSALRGAVARSTGLAIKEDDVELLCLLEECHDVASDKYHTESCGDFVGYMLDEVEDLVNTHMIPDQFQEHIN